MNKNKSFQQNQTYTVTAIEDASGWQKFSYGKLGEVTENIRTFALPFEEKPYTFVMKYEYDSWNRIQRMTYPDGEVVSYGYNYGGMLKSVTGEKNGIQYPYINDISYNEFELKEIVDYGNGAQTIYNYDILQRLSHLESWSASGTMQLIDYSYDAVGNIDKIVNYAGMTSNGLGGLYENSYSYDNQYRLDYASGYWDGAEMLNYETKLSYYDNGRIKSKMMEADLFAPSDNGMSHLSYDYNYRYHNLAQPNTLTDIDNSYHHHFEWDVKGNMVFHHNEHAGFDRRLCWDEQNRLQGVVDDTHQTFYQYDANGERTYKLTTSEQAQMVNGRWYYYTIMDNATLYASPYLVATRKGYTKHYYAESERIASKIGMGGLTDICQCLCPDMILPSGNQGGDPMNPLPDCEGPKECFYDKLALNHDHFDRVMRECLGSDLNIEPKTLNETLYNLRENMDNYEPDCYWYHPDHLGSSSWITHADGTAVQHLHYLPWGEDFVDQRTSDFSARYTFSAKEKDTETGLSYFGSRYYSSDLSIWLSVDPMSDKYPSLSPYVYCANNPIKLVDPNGEEIGDYFNQYGKYLGTDNVDNGKVLIIDDNLWNSIEDVFTTKGEDGTRIISQGIGEFLSDKPSSLDLSDDAIQKIVGHYNSTGLKLNRGNKGALNTEFNGSEESYTKKLTINISKWRNHSFLDNYYDIKNSFDHEKGHITQCEEMGIVMYDKLTLFQQEKYAVDYQKSQPAFSRTSEKYKKWVDTYLQGKKK